MKTKWLVLLVIALFCATGCSSMSKRAKCASVGAAAGAAVGATVGGIIGHNNTGAHVRTEGAIVGGGIGAIVGGVAGYLICKDEPAPAPPAPAPAPAPAPVAEKIVLNGVQFDFDKAVIKDEYFPVLDAAASALQKHGNKKVMITGHTCNMGPDSYNQTLSEKRAAAVKAYLVDKGVSETRLMTSGAGEANPVADNKTKDGRMMNRRAELVVIN
jgi:outer membrane protein OmpA-like peptidoglycan-associated protein